MMVIGADELFLLELKLEPDIEVHGALQEPLNAHWLTNKILVGKATPQGDILIKLNRARVEALLPCKG